MAWLHWTLCPRWLWVVVAEMVTVGCCHFVFVVPALPSLLALDPLRCVRPQPSPDLHDIVRRTWGDVVALQHSRRRGRATSACSPPLLFALLSVRRFIKYSLPLNMAYFAMNALFVFAALCAIRCVLSGVVRATTAAALWVCRGWL